MMQTTYDVIVVGGGTSGMMAAITAAQQGAKTLLLEKNKRLGRKLLLTGGGRCNVTNNRPAEDLIRHIPGNGKFLYSAFSQWDNYDLMAFFESRGVHLKEEDHGRMFPVTDQSKTIVEALATALKETGVTLCFETPVTKLIRKDQQIYGVRTDKGDFKAPCVILTTGGRTYPSTGSTGDGYRLAKSAGHSITPLYSTESPLISEEAFIKAKKLQGLALQDVDLTVWNAQGRAIVSQQMDLLFTHFGLSGPAALRCSSFINQLLAEQPAVTVTIDSFPALGQEALTRDLLPRLHSKKTLKNALHGWLPERFLTYLLEQLNLEDVIADQLTKDQTAALVQLSKKFPVSISKTFPLEKSFVTGGGIQLKEIDPKTLESKKVNGLFAAGELLDINGYTGGYNITAAFVTGHAAGLHAAEIAGYTYLT